MDRFEEENTFYETNIEPHLHSSMDRFEAVATDGFDEFVAIYIPVWIDLKLEFQQVSITKARNLHSSMDRFEEYSSQALSILIHYLHSSMDRFEANAFDISKPTARLFTFQYG